MIVAPSEGRRRPAAATLGPRATRRRTVAAIARGVAILLPAIAADAIAGNLVRTSALTAADQSSGVGVPLAPWRALAAAAPAHRVGETVLASLLVAGSGRGDPLALNAAIGGLERVGLASDARRLAVEAALAAGL
jgi:hypothetical protein